MFLIQSNVFAMTFSQPIEIGRFFTQIQRTSGFYMNGEILNNGTRFTKMAPYMKDYGWDKGVAIFGDSSDLTPPHS